MCIGIIVSWFAQKDSRICCLYYAAMFALLSILTSFGLNEPRYAIIALPFYAIFIGGLIGVSWNTGIKRIYRKKEFV